jgi:hypothetical protein
MNKFNLTATTILVIIAVALSVSIAIATPLFVKTTVAPSLEVKDVDGVQQSASELQPAGAGNINNLKTDTLRVK